jgi:hypothetical protein
MSSMTDIVFYYSYSLCWSTMVTTNALDFAKKQRKQTAKKIAVSINKKELQFLLIKNLFQKPN